MSHEKSITVEMDGKHYNVNSVVKGKQLSAKAAVSHAKKSGGLRGPFKTNDEAVQAAKSRSSAHTNIIRGE